MIDFVGQRRYFGLLSSVLIVPCLLALAFWQLNPGIDFNGGLELEVRFLREVEERDIAIVANDLALPTPAPPPAMRAPSSSPSGWRPPATSPGRIRR